jgi:AraC-like DNA-binding protein
MPYLIRSACLTDYVEIASSVGLDPFSMLDAVGLPRSCLGDPDIKIPVGAFGRLLETSAKVANADDFGLRLAERRQLSIMGPVALIVREQPTVRKAIDALSAYIHLHNEAQSMRVEEIDDLVIINAILARRRPLPARQAVELMVGTVYRILRMFLGSGWRAQWVSFTHSAPANLETHRRVFRSKVEFGQDFDGVVCGAHDLEAPVPHADPAMARYVQQYVDTIASRPMTTNDRVRELVRIMLPSQTCSADQVAKCLDIDRRTLQRRLADNGQTFSGIVDEVRAEMVVRYMDDPNRPLAVIAEMLGFSALSAFSRWFRSQYGCSASQWRAGRSQPS